jgi:uncharacterized membrane protein YkvA (DUF1232 family)
LDVDAKVLDPPPPMNLSDRLARRGLRLFRRRAESTSREPSRLRALADRVQATTEEHGEEIGALRDDLPVLVRLVRAYARGSYRRLPWRSLVTLVSALIYVVVPTDLIPDLIPVIGFVDDAAVVALAVRALRGDLDAFRRWERE